MKFLSIETSCDETAAAILKYENSCLSVLSSVVSSQVALHAAYGGVVPNLAAREHVRNIIPVVEEALQLSKLTPNDIDAIGVTKGPGLIPALLVGVSAAKTLALAWNKPLLGINHLEGHIYANCLSNTKDEAKEANLPFPLLALIVSGGHTQLILMCDHFQYELLGETEDDAAGEAFDKVAKMLGLPYPGGPEVAKRADAFRTEKGSPEAHLFPRPKLTDKDYDFSFSGLKTAVLYFLKEHTEQIANETFVAKVSHEFQEAVVDVLVGKTERAIQEFQPKTIIIAGGVSANKRLRERMTETVTKHEGANFMMPPFEYSLDNAAMIGAAGILRFAKMSEAERETLKRNAVNMEPSAHLPLVQNA